MKDISKKLFVKLLLSLVVVRFAMIALLMLGFPDINFLNDGFFPSNSGGDEHTYYALAQNFANFNLQDTYVVPTIGTPLFFVPFIWITGAETIKDVIPLVFIFQTFIMYAISIFMVAYIAYKLLRSRKLGFVAAAIYVFSPYLMLLVNVGPYSNNYGSFIDLMWLRTLYSDSPSALFVYAGLALFLYSLNHKKAAILSAAMFGISALIRIPNIFIGLSLSFIYLLKRSYQKFLVFNFIFLAFFSVQLLFNQSVNGHFLQFSNYNKEVVEIMEDRYETHSSGKISELGFSFGNYFYFLSILDKYIPGLPVVLIVVISAISFTFYYYFKTSKQEALIVFLWILFFSLFFFGYAPAARNVRHWLPVLPAFIILGVKFFTMINFLIKK